MGVLPAEQLAMTRPDALAAILYHGAVPAAEFGGSWPADVALQIHINEHDPWCEEDLPAARELPGELFVYGGSTHLVYEPDAKLVLERTLALLSTFATTA